MDAKRDLVLKLHLNGFKKSQILSKLHALDVNYKFIQRTIARYNDSGSVRIKKKVGRKKSVRTQKLIKTVRERFRRNPRQSGRKMARKLNVSNTTFRRLVKEDLGLKAYKRRRIHGLTEKNKMERVKRCKRLVQRHANSEILFTDEKLFVLQETYNPQNDRFYSATFQECPTSIKSVQRFQNHTSVMVWGAVSKKGRLPLLFIDKGVKINKEYYLESVLKDHMMKYIPELYENQEFVFQQDSAPSHGSKIVQTWLNANLPNFIRKEDWPATSPDLNVMDYFVWSYMEQNLGNVAGLHLDGFKQRLIKIWNEIPQEHIRAACESFPKRLRSCIVQKGERFELD